MYIVEQVENNKWVPWKEDNGKVPKFKTKKEADELIFIINMAAGSSSLGMLRIAVNQNKELIMKLFNCVTGKVVKGITFSGIRIDATRFDVIRENPNGEDEEHMGCINYNSEKDEYEYAPDFMDTDFTALVVKDLKAIQHMMERLNCALDKNPT